MLFRPRKNPLGKSSDWFGYLLNVVLSPESMCVLVENIFYWRIGFSFFGFASLFSVLPRYGIYKPKCTSVGSDCSGQIGEYQVGVERKRVMKDRGEIEREF
jgi:hypothetical protein